MQGFAGQEVLLHGCAWCCHLTAISCTSVVLVTQDCIHILLYCCLVYKGVAGCDCICCWPTAA